MDLTDEVVSTYGSCMGQSVKLGGDVYDEVPQAANIAAKAIADMWVRLGRPQTPFTPSGEKMMDIMIAVWEDLYPLQAKMWYEDRKDYKLNELSTREQVRKHTGRSLASYPLPVYNMMKKVFRGFDPAERKNCMKIVKKWPMFLMANRA